MGVLRTSLFVCHLSRFTFLDILDVNSWSVSWLKKYSSDIYSFCVSGSFVPPLKSHLRNGRFVFKVISACSKARQWSSVRSWEGQPKKLVQFWGCQSLRLRKSVYSKFLFQVKDLWEIGQSTINFFCFRWCVSLFNSSRSKRRMHVQTTKW